MNKQVIFPLPQSALLIAKQIKASVDSGESELVEIVTEHLSKLMHIINVQNQGTKERASQIEQYERQDSKGWVCSNCGEIEGVNVTYEENCALCGGKL